MDIPLKLYMLNIDKKNIYKSTWASGVLISSAILVVVTIFG